MAKQSYQVFMSCDLIMSIIANQVEQSKLIISLWHNYFVHAADYVLNLLYSDGQTNEYTRYIGHV